MNAMDLEDAKHYLGGSFEFMGVAVRAKEIEQRRPEMVALTKALADALKALRGMTGEQLVAAFPKEMTTGLDLKEFGEIIVRHRDALYPETVNIDLDAAKRVEQSLIARRPDQGRREHVRAARHDDRRRLKAARPRSDDLLWRGAGPRRRRASPSSDGRFVSLVGPSGSGKSSLLRAVIGLQQPLSGTVETDAAALASSASCSRTMRCCRGRRRATMSRSA